MDGSEQKQLLNRLLVQLAQRFNIFITAPPPRSVSRSLLFGYRQERGGLRWAGGDEESGGRGGGEC